jgi:hypothetical protein
MNAERRSAGRPLWLRLAGWSAALLVAGLLLAFLVLIVKPLLDAHDLVRRAKADCPPEEFQAAVAELGGPGETARKLGLYCRTSRRIAPEREWAAWLLGGCGPEAAPHLLALLDDEDPAVRIAAISGLGRLRERRAVELLVGFLGGSDEALRVASARALGRIGDPRATGPLVALLSVREVAVRGAAAQALGRLGDAGAVEPLAAALGDWSLLVRESAAVSLGMLADRRAIPALEKLSAREGQTSAGQEARAALEKIRAAAPGASDSER